MSDFVLTDNLTSKRINLTFEEFYDLKIGLMCANEEYSQEESLVERSEEFLTLNKKMSWG
tara:strand:+ start:211 stop:390 length:180 start_codon:yes stop_codon:yes gene_type:complete